MHKVKPEYADFKISGILDGKLVQKKMGELTQTEIEAYLLDTQFGGKYFDKADPEKATEKALTKKGE